MIVTGEGLSVIYSIKVFVVYQNLRVCVCVCVCVRADLILKSSFLWDVLYCGRVPAANAPGCTAA